MVPPGAQFNVRQTFHNARPVSSIPRIGDNARPRQYRGGPAFRARAPRSRNDRDPRCLPTGAPLFLCPKADAHAGGAIVKEHLENLVELQQKMIDVESIDERITAIPAEVAALEKGLLAMQQEIEAARLRLDELQSDRRRLEGDLQAVETKIQKYQAQLAEIKTNKEYQVILKEIEACRAGRAALDEKILLEMEEGDGRSEEFRVLEGRLKEKENETRQGKKRLDDQAAALRKRREELDAERVALSDSIPREYLAPFTKVANQRRGLALVAVRDELCGGCHVRVMPKLIQQVRRASGLIACDSCKRFLYVPDPPAEKPAPAAEQPAR